MLPIEEHKTDTHGYPEMIFADYDLLGLRFAPRIRDLDRRPGRAAATVPVSGSSATL